MSRTRFSAAVCDMIGAKLGEKNMLSAELADLIGMKPAHLCSILNGEKPLHVDVLERIAKGLGMTIADLMPPDCPQWCVEHYADHGTIQRHFGEDQAVYVHRDYPEKSVRVALAQDAGSAETLLDFTVTDDASLGTIILDLTPKQAFDLSAILANVAMLAELGPSEVAS